MRNPLLLFLCLHCFSLDRVPIHYSNRLYAYIHKFRIVCWQCTACHTCHCFRDEVIDSANIIPTMEMISAQFVTLQDSQTDFEDSRYLSLYIL